MQTLHLQRNVDELKEVLQFWGLDDINLEELNDVVRHRMNDNVTLLSVQCV